MTAGDQEAAPTPDRVPSRQHIRVVVDDAQIRHLAAKLLREHGYGASVARDVGEMWQAAALNTAGVDLEILDGMLPGTAGQQRP